MFTSVFELFFYPNLTMAEAASLYYFAEMFASILETFECVVCTEYMVPPILSCKVGHNFCHKCHRKLDVCPVCRGPKKGSRNYGLESIFGKLSVPCKYKEKGCTAICKGEDLREHQLYCQHSRIQCPLRAISNCQTVIDRADLMSHCIAHHSSNVFRSNVMKLIWPRFCFRPFAYSNRSGDSCHVLCEAYGELFKCAWKLDATSGLTRWCVVFLGPKSRANEFQFELLLESREKNAAVSIICCCHPDREVLFQEGKSIVIPVGTIRKLCRLQGLYFNLIIYRTGEERPATCGAGNFIVPEKSVSFDLYDAAVVKARRFLREHNIRDDDDDLDDF